MLVLAGEFPEVDERLWRAAVDRVLARYGKELSAAERDALFQRTMTSKTYDGIAIKALYTARDLASTDPPAAPGFPPFVRGASIPGGIVAGWDVRQRVDLEGDGSTTAQTILEELENGTTSIWLSLAATPSFEVLDGAVQGVRLDLAPIVFDARNDGPTAARVLISLWNQRGLVPETIRGSFGLDPIGLSASLGEGVIDLAAERSRAMDVARVSTRQYPGVWTFVIDATRYHEAGASDVEELACATATGVEYLRWLTEAGLDPETALSQLEFRFAVSDDQFMAIGKLRAARRLWNRVGEIIGAAPVARGQRQHAVTSRSMIARYDPWVNLLRSSIACLAAGVAGTAAITVIPHDDASSAAPSKLGRRLARNVQSILIEEAHLSRVIDPGSGSWYLESLTEAIARAAWQWFRDIEGLGGMSQALASGVVHRRIATTQARRSQNLAYRRDPITGVSEFPDISENPAARSETASKPEPAENALPFVRYAAAFEQLRMRADRALQKSGARPSIFLANLGPIAEHTARATFCKNLFETGGICTILSETITAGTVAEVFRQSGANLACICGDTQRYAAEAEPVARELAAAGATRIYLAGNPGPLRSVLENAGVQEFVTAGCDAIALLDNALAYAGVT
jgi:methylmalonyl-CoA mutase